jgi:hypothetical protein
MRRYTLIFICLLVLASAGRIGADDLVKVDSAVVEARDRAIGWLKEQMVPNEIVPDPDPERRRLVLSYRVSRDHPAHPYIYSRSFAYDNALAVIALTMAGDYEEAELILSALRRVMRDDGSFWFTYNTVNNWPGEYDHEGAIIRSGANAWIGYAATYYLTARLRRDPYFLEDLLAVEVLDMAKRIAAWLLARQIDDELDLRNGLVTGGRSIYELTLSDTDGAPVERYRDEEIAWVSMEHNIDAYYFLRDLGRITEEGPYAEAAMRIKRGLRTFWLTDRGQFMRGIKGDQVLDTALPLDGASWASMFLFSIGERSRAERCLQTAEQYFRTRSGAPQGYRPYYKEPVFEEETVNAHYYPHDPRTRWKDLDIVWGEGSLGVAAAYIKSGKPRKALEIIEDMLLLRVGDGLRYATEEIPYQFSRDPSVASTAWFVIAVEMLMNPDTNNSFWDR